MHTKYYVLGFPFGVKNSLLTGRILSKLVSCEIRYLQLVAFENIFSVSFIICYYERKNISFAYDLPLSSLLTRFYF